MEAFRQLTTIYSVFVESRVFGFRRVTLASAVAWGIFDLPQIENRKLIRFRWQNTDGCSARSINAPFIGIGAYAAGSLRMLFRFRNRAERS